MAFIKAQKIVYDDSGRIISGSASVVDAVYVRTGGSAHSRQQVREKLGRVLYLSADRKTGVFLSPTRARGLVEYDSVSDSFSPVEKDDPRINGETLFPQTEIHTVFGDAYLFLNFLEKCGLLSVLRSVFPKDEEYERVLCHILHGILKDGSRISCDNFIRKSFASYLFPDVPAPSLHSDTRFFGMLGDDHVKMSFFRTFVSAMQKKDPDFGKGCYVDSTPLPNDIDDNPFNALCCHGVAASEVMTRLILVLDEKSGLPVWYDVIPGNVLDINTVMTVVNYPYKTLYWEVRDLIGKGKYAFVRKHHAYFGFRKEIELFGNREYAYVYVDQYNALKRFSDYLSEHEDEYAELKVRDKDWMTVKFGYFVLVSNLDLSPKDLLTEYFGRTDIEVVFKTSKEYLDLLPLSKWTDQTVRGKILHDIINTVCLLELRKNLLTSGRSVSEIIGRCQSLMCFRNNKGIVTVETPSKQVKDYFKLLHTEVPAHVDLGRFTPVVMNAKM